MRTDRFAFTASRSFAESSSSKNSPFVLANHHAALDAKAPRAAVRVSRSAAFRYSSPGHDEDGDTVVEVVVVEELLGVEEAGEEDVVEEVVVEEGS